MVLACASESAADLPWEQQPSRNSCSHKHHDDDDGGSCVGDELFMFPTSMSCGSLNMSGASALFVF